MMNVIKENLIESELKYDNTTILTYKIKYPQITNSR